MAISNTPVLANVTIIIDSKDSVPVATTDSPLGSNEKVRLKTRTDRSCGRGKTAAGMGWHLPSCSF
jgi:hypothetical protein